MLCFDDFVSEPLAIRNGIDQGCPLSVIFYLLYNAPLIRIADPDRRELCIGYIDDVTLIAWGRSFEETHSALADMIVRRGGAMDWSRSHNSTFEFDKTACIDFTRRREPDPERLRKTRPVAREDLSWEGSSVATVAQHTFLGVLIDQELNWKAHANRALAKGTNWVSQVYRIARTTYGVSARVARKLYVSIAIPRFSYAADIWFRPVVTGQNGRLSGSIGVARKLARIQRTAALTILGGMRSTPTASLDAHARLLPMHLLLNQTCARAAIRLASHPEMHPLHTAVRQSSRGRKSHRTPLHDILALVDIPPTRFAKLTRRNPRLPAPTRSFPPKKNAITLAKSDRSATQVWVDGSHGGSGVSAALVLVEHGRVTETLGVKIGQPKEYSVLDSEIIALRLAIHLLRPMLILENVTIFSDSQEAVRLVDPESGKPTLPLAVTTAKELKLLRRRNGGIQITLSWAPGHSGLRYGDLVDAEARLAADGKDYGDRLPITFSRALPAPVDPGYYKICLTQSYREEAERYWLSTDSGTKYQSRYHGSNAHLFLDHIEGLSRRKHQQKWILLWGALKHFKAPKSSKASTSNVQFLKHYTVL
ncbi:Reverse transcriptase from transposon X-element protein [Ceratobasidium sp. AG-Ba]|nr:Reverse transcriptase from transposon X-element protein [Ceratobasidium sp. AG-Ba]